MMIKRISFFAVCILCFLNTQCDEDDLPPGFDTFCDETVIVDNVLFDSLESDDFQFGSAEIFDNCLSIQVIASGCSGDTWGFKLVDSEAIAESLPEQRNIKLEFVNNEDCDAVIGHTVSFDIEALQIDNTVNQVILHLEGWVPSLTYSY